MWTKFNFIVCLGAVLTNSLIIVDKYNIVNVMPSFIEAELKQLLEASTRMNRAKNSQIEQMTDTLRRKEGELKDFSVKLL